MPRPAPASLPTPRLVDGPAGADATVLLAHGAGGGMETPFLATIATGLAGRGWRVVRFAFPFMARRQQGGRRGVPDRLPKLLEVFREQVGLERGAAPLVLAGKSLGGRVATLLLEELAGDAPPAEDRGVCGGLCFGYPFHPPGRPETLRTAHLEQLPLPTLIVQGSRDPFGRRAEVEGYALAPAIQLAWIAGGDHSLKPARGAGLSPAEALAVAVEAADAFLRQILLTPGMHRTP
ncbi:MAG: alpha/beta family hydrolase [Synechococcaceae cyanobacterium]|nr:alpha/beta family hydrolase [Synechococcaceae cyanobacterium]